MSLVREYRLPFKVRIPSADAGPVSGDDLLAALKAQMDRFERDPQLLLEAVGPAADVTDEVSWVLRRIGSPGVIRQADGGWITVEPGELQDRDVTSSDHASTLPPGSEGFWCRSWDAFEEEVLGHLHSDDRMIETVADVRPWLAEADAGEISELMSQGWGYCEAADQVVHYLESIGDPAARRLFSYLELQPTMGFTREPVGFGFSLDEGEVLAWLRAHRPDLSQELASDPFAGPVGI